MWNLLLFLIMEGMLVGLKPPKKTFAELIFQHEHENFELVERRKGSKIVCHESMGRKYFYRYNRHTENETETEVKIWLHCIYRRK